MRPALGSFQHEAVAVDPVGRRLYMTEDRGDGGLYRFTPAAYPDLGAGLLEVMLDGGGWAPVPDPAGITAPTRQQVVGMRQFNGGEGIWFDSGTVYFSTKGDNRIWAHDTATGGLTTIYDRAATPDAPLSGVDNLTVSRAGEIFVCEDGGDMEICVIEPGGAVAPFLKLVGEAAEGLPDRGNELAGVVFDPSGDRLYFAAQRAFGFGAVYEVTGPFRAGVAPPAPVAAGAPAAPPSLRIRAPRRISLASLRKSGLVVEVLLDEPAELRFALRTDDLRRVPGARGSTARPKTVTLDRHRLRRARRRARVRLRVSGAEARRLRKASRVVLQVAVTARGADGAVRVASRRVRLR